MTLKRARDGSGISAAELETLEQRLWDILLTRFRRKTAPSSVPNNFTDDLVSSLLTLYGQLRAKVEVPEGKELEAMWVVAEHVVVPTIFTTMVRYQGCGLGAEFNGADSWYVANPRKRGSRWPVARILDRWLRASGFRTAYGVARKPKRSKAGTPLRDEEKEFLRWQAEQKWVQRCRNGDHLPRLNKFDRLVRRFPASVAWLDGVKPWRARFALAYALQIAGRTADRVFREIHSSPSKYLSMSLLRMTRERYLCDDGKLLADAHLFFASRLLERRLRKNGELAKIMAKVPQKAVPDFKHDPTDAELETWKRKAQFEMNAGNWLLDYLCRDVTRDSLGVNVRQHVFDLGVAELNRLIKEEVGERTRRPS